MYVALEGIDTSGKSTQIQALKEYYPDAIFTKEPGGSRLGERLRDILLYDSDELSSEAEVLLFLADRAQLIKEVIKPNLDRLIISDRSLISGIAYASRYDFNILQTLNLFATNSIVPNKVIFLELSEAELRSRLGGKKQDKIESRGLDYLMSLQDRMIDVISRLGIPNIRLQASDEVSYITDKIIQFIDSK